VMLTGFSWPRVAEGLRILESQPTGEERLLRLVADYAVPNVSEKVVRLIVSYTDYVKRVVLRSVERESGAEGTAGGHQPI
jgi:UDP-N-acetyl-L-fucosamine synthase